MIAASIVFWLSAGLIVYAHAGYPLLLRAWAKRSTKPILEGDALPAVTIIVVAHDEESRIAARIENLRALDYPADRMSIVIGSDGSRDATVSNARAQISAEGAAVRVVDFPEQRGKPSALNELIPTAQTEIVVLGDARQRFEPQVLRALVAPFADPTVGAVSGELMLEAGEGGGGAGLYWQYEKFLRKHESLIDSTVGATGAIYAIRRELFEPLPPDTVLDDMLIPCRILKRGLRVVFEPRAKAHDRAADPGAELQRKARTLSGNFQLFAREKWLLDPRQNRVWIQTVSHKILRLAVPLLLAATLISSAVLARHRFFAVMLGLQLAFYGAALVGGLLSKAGRRAPGLSTAWMFCVLHWATVLGFVRFLRGGATATWKQSARAAAALKKSSSHRRPEGPALSP
jgi:biofilm PGA synthesis N-glycosyltransferase PgaC